MSDEPHFLSQIETAVLPNGVAIRLKTMIEPGRPGPQLEFLVSPDRASELAQSILETVEEWKDKHQH